LTRLRFEVVTATADEVAETLERMWTSTAPGPVVSLGDIPSRLETNVLVAIVGIVWIGGFLFLFRDALQPRFGLSLLALLCGFFFFIYALRYYVISASVLFIALFGDSFRMFRRRRTAAPLAAAPPTDESETVDLHGRITTDASSTHREGFKGGALQEALGRMNPRTEYVLIFDADFVPPADAIWHFLDYFGRLAAKPKGADRHTPSTSGVPQNGDRLAAVQGYQWHMLNASENWITKGVRAEFAGSYVLERTGQELFGAMKMISGSVYMIRADVLRKLGWSTSITEDWELTIRLYLAGYKVLYTPYIQSPAECVSTVQRLIK